jgi:hypothetical protein
MIEQSRMEQKRNFKPCGGFQSNGLGNPQSLISGE